ncbi:hypothetical protein SKUN_001215 [Spiroplasma kunkelii CR2-3x]|uniref:Uncharacterized protein n=1 Tax=Spiroplasma kunkelii CR2-3x TaxID=273035 RepID=A0A0K2JHL7_SPIKU|nr:hypothetical protein [Spiroplasma kunkelii]ALA98090.1 hypothetical protein SKUN_001215 [Spiroplasma kunkelii CR2-3x]
MKVTPIILGTLGAISSAIPAINTFNTSKNPTTVEVSSIKSNSDNLWNDSFRDQIENIKNKLDNMDSSLTNSSKILEDLNQESSIISMDDLQEIFNAIMGENDREDIIEETIQSAFAEASYDSITVGETIESGLLTGSLGTVVTALGLATAIALVIYGGYYTYTNWDDIKSFSNKAVNNAKHYISTTTDYLKS